MSRKSSVSMRRALLRLSALSALFATFIAFVLAGPVEAQTPVGGKIKADGACYVRLPDMPAARYGGFGAYNADTGVLAFAGGAEKRTQENTITYHDLWAIKLDGTEDRWTTINYSGSVGYTREQDKGCREMASLQLAPSKWLSVLGKDGCDNGNVDASSKKGGDVKALQIGETADRAGVRWLNDKLNVGSVPRDLATNKGKLVRHFAVLDTQRGRGIFGQGTFDDEKDQETQDKVYSAVASGSNWNVREMHPSGNVPTKRFSSCAAYVYDADSGVDGVIVLGGQQGGPSGSSTTSYKEVWWLDFSSNQNGVWSDITARFANMDEIGYRRGGACAYDPDSKMFYSWMGRADASVPDGKKRSAGAWRVDLATLGDASASLSWQRLAKDDLGGIEGRRLIPSVYDRANKRLFVMGGRNDLDEYKDVWAIYPDVTGADCDALDPYAPFAPQPTEPPPPTNTPDPSMPTNTPVAAVPTPTPLNPAEGIQVCARIEGRVPGAARNAAAGNPQSVAGYNTPCNPNVPHNPVTNPLRKNLGLRNPNLPYHPIYNGLVLKCGCP